MATRGASSNWPDWPSPGRTDPMPRPIRTLLFSTLYPNSVRPQHGIFVETRLRHLLSSGQVETRVVAPVPWFPVRHRVFGEYGDYAAVPDREGWNGVSVEHPRYLLLPKIGMSLAPVSLANVGLAAARRLIAAGFDFDLIDAHYFYPDGVAATIIGKALGKPVVITARGSDVNLIPNYAKPRQMILEAAAQCAAVIAVSAALKDALVRLGVSAGKVTVLRNGVDVDLFHPEERELARARVGAARFSLASVGNLIPSKGHQFAIGALHRLPDVELFLAGRGGHEDWLRSQAREIGVGDRVHFLGTMPQPRLRTLYSAVDALVLASAREGWPNVLLEAMACGTPVLASETGGIPEIVGVPEAGRLIGQGTADDIVRGVEALRRSPVDRDATRKYAERFLWEPTTEGQLSIFRRYLPVNLLTP